MFVRAAGARFIVSVQDPIIFGEHSEPEPDLALIQPRDDFYALALPRADEVLLIVEVADTALRYDREIKIPLYARHGIPEVWLIDVEGRTLTVFETPADGRYRNERRVRARRTRLRPRRSPGSRWICRDSSERLEEAGMAEPFLSDALEPVPGVEVNGWLCPDLAEERTHNRRHALYLG